MSNKLSFHIITQHAASKVTDCSPCFSSRRSHKVQSNIQRGCNDEGAVLILLLVLASTIFAFIALGIDTGLLSITRRDHSTMAPTVASAALKTFTATTGTFDERFNAARISAEESAQSALDSATTTTFYKNRGYTVELGTVSNPGSSGYIEAGIWHFAPIFSPPYFDSASGACIKRNAEQCPCNDNGTWNAPCFEKLDAASANPLPSSDPSIPVFQPQVTAIRVQLASPDDSPLQTRFAGTFGGHAAFQIASTAIVAARPIRMVILFDLSRSVHSETHIPYETVSYEPSISQRYNAGEYAYRILNKSCEANEPPPATGLSDTSYVNSLLTCKPSGLLCAYGTTPSNAALGPSDCQLGGGISFSAVDNAFDAMWNLCGNPPFIPPGKSRSNSRAAWHSKADYRCVTVNPSINGVAQGESHYLVDSFRGGVQPAIPGGGLTNYRGAEPLETMLEALRRSMERFEDREIYGDRIAIIGFDQDARIEQRIFPLTEPNPNVARYQTMKDLVAENADLNLRHQQHMWFAREDAMLNLPEALKEAFTLLTEGPEFQYSDNHIVLISDGVSECYHDQVLDEQVCDKRQAAVEQSLADSLALVEDQFTDNSIKLNVLLLGELVQPHSVVRKSPASAESERCMTEDEARNSDDGTGNPFAWINATENSATYRDATTSANFNQVSNKLEYSQTERYHRPNLLYQAVALTNGVWGAVRPSCQPNLAQLSGGTCESGRLERFLDQQCAALNTPGELLTNINGSSPIVDAHGRLVCDPRCRNREAQLRAYVDKIFESFPYLAVQNNIQVH